MRIKKTVGLKSLNGGAKVSKKQVLKNVEEKKKSVTERDKRKYIDYKIKVKKGDPLPSFREDNIRLNKFMSNAGICSRREADVLIQTGVVSVNGKVVTELGYKIQSTDYIQYDGETVSVSSKRYVLLNKPKGYITAIDDPRGRKTVMTLVNKACKEQIFPMGKMDRDTTGLLLFTNDGDLAKKLMHPRYQASKLYHVELNKSISKEDLEKLLKGLDLADGKTKAEKAVYVEGGTSKEVGIEIRSGKQQIVRRLFEALGFQIIKLDRVQYAGLTKKDLPRGYYRHLTDQEISFLKMTK
jgi:23S rRNA pseudouridine2605 synthase